MDTLSTALSLSPKRNITSVDKRELSCDDLPKALQDELNSTNEDAFLWTSKRPSKNWHACVSDWRALKLSSSALFEQIFWVRDSLTLKLPIEIQKEHEFLLKSYPSLFTNTGPVTEDETWLTYKDTLLAHVQREEKVLYPEATKALPIERSLKELHYEHLGLEKGIKRLPDILTAFREGQLSGKEREKFDLDYYHLLEHHLERESEAVYPLILFLSKG